VTVAQANLKAAHAQRALLGPAVSALNQQGYLWVRATVYAGDLERIDRQATATVQPLGGEGVRLTAKPVNAPPSANAAAGTVDLYFGFSNTGNAVSVGQRVSVELPVRGAPDTGLTIPASALLRDIYGGEWVYVRTGPHAYERRRVEIATAKDGYFQLNRGLKSGDEVVTAGAAELFGTEFGAK
ncbi:efflux RND transporter periplasmic adaptor subunit, partial [Asticcacaulis biprosthecium]|uniref:efflux RND transporter periplasmic adaptor subunit n=1 Tax=Asticcacaulis biprosthecium TaxID=76891 RepID=UPI001B7FA0DC